MFYFKKPISILIVRLWVRLIALIGLGITSTSLFNSGVSASSSHVASGFIILVLDCIAILFTLFIALQIYQLVADILGKPANLIGFVITKERLLKDPAPTRLGQLDFQPRVKGYTLRLLPPEWLQEYYDEEQGKIPPRVRSRRVLLWRDNQTLFRVPPAIFNMVLEQDLVRIIYGPHLRVVFGLEVLSSITPPSASPPMAVKETSRLLPYAPPYDAAPAQWREIED